MPYFDVSVDIAVMCHYASPTTIFSSASIVFLFELRTPNICHLRLTAIGYEYGRALTASNASSDVVLLQKKRFSTDWRPLDPRLVVRQRPVGTPLTASLVHVCIYWVSRTPLSSQTRFPLASGRPMEFRGVWTPDSCSPHRITPPPIVTQGESYDLRKRTETIVHAELRAVLR